LLHYSDNLNIEEKERTFSTRAPIQLWKERHLYVWVGRKYVPHYPCKYLNIEEKQLSYGQIFYGNITEQINIFVKALQ
jgi:hypothetical protein